MVKYYYDKYNAIGTNNYKTELKVVVPTMWRLSQTYVARNDLDSILYNNGGISQQFEEGVYKGVTVDSSGNLVLNDHAGNFQMYTYSGIYSMVAPGQVGTTGFYSKSRNSSNIYYITMERTIVAEQNVRVTIYKVDPIFLNTTYTLGTLAQSNIVAEDGTYPTNGRHTDGYWYIRSKVVNNAPSLTLATTDNRTLYENDQFNVTGQVTDTDVGNVVTTKFSINGGTERAITATISQGTALTYNKVLTFKQGKLFDGANAITDTLTDGSQHVLRVWAEDDKGGKSAEQVRVFYVVANRSAVLTINPVTSVSDLIDSDTIAISGNVSDPDGNTVTVRYKIGNGLYAEVYSGTGGAFNFNVALADLQTGVNTVTIQATDSYGLSTTKTLRVTKNANSKPLLKSVATYKLTPPNGSADGIVLWVQRETGDLIVNAEISMGANGAVENFVPMTKQATAYVTDSVEEDEFVFDNGEVSAENIIVRLTMERTSATSDKTIKLISGVLS